LWAMHARGVELDHSVSVGQTAIADTIVQRIELHDIDARDHRIEHVRAAGDHGESLLHGGYSATVFEAIAVRRRDYQRLDDALLENARKAFDLISSSGQRNAGNRPIAHEITAFHSFAHGVLVCSVVWGHKLTRMSLMKKVLSVLSVSVSGQ